MSRHLHLNAFLMGVGHHEAAWRSARTAPTDVTSLEHFVHLAEVAERGKLDSLFLADGLSLGKVEHNALGGLEPLTLLSALAARTSRIGLIGTVSSTYSAPYTLARAFASLDHLSQGRAGWNIVTSADAAAAHNFGREPHAAHSDRYARAEEFLQVATALWDSWDEDAVLADQASGDYADRSRIHEVDHQGEHFSVRGPLNISRSPQGRPLLVQAGSSGTGKDFAARWAEAVFTAQQTLAEGQDFYRDLKSRVSAAGRDPEHVKVLPGICPVIGATEAEARALEAELQGLLVPTYGLAQLSQMLQIELTPADLDKPLPPLPDEDDINGGKSRFSLVADLAERDQLTVREVIARLAGGRGHRVVVGTPEQIADALELWFHNGAADGFNIMPPYLPGGLEDFVDQVIPELQRRDLFRTDYEAGNLRARYGLPQHTSARLLLPA
ncbi:MAG: monooxygenase [Frankiales bacterium]|nr:monooxygenase [Frankiales bacterium]